MTDTFDYQKAQEFIKQGWTKGNLYDNGRVCLVGGLQAAHFGNKSQISVRYILPLEVSNDILRQLHRYPSYWFFMITSSWAESTGAELRMKTIEAWNDLPWRRKRTVMRVLKRASKRQQKQESFLTAERDKLQVEVLNLRAEVAQLKAQIARLETENAGLWARLTNKRQAQIDADHATLAALEAELDEKWNALQGAS